MTKINNSNNNKAKADTTSLINNGCNCALGPTGTNTFSNNKKDSNAKTTVEAILSSNTKFQAISAISVAQDGVVNIADQGMIAIKFY